MRASSLHIGLRQRPISNCAWGSCKRAHLWNSRKLGEKQDEAPILRFPPPLWGRDREGGCSINIARENL
jgi:hypothetical protein